MNDLLKMLAILTGAAGLYVLLSPRVAERLYHPLLFEPQSSPHPHEVSELADVGPFEDAFFSTRNGRRLHGWHFQGQQQEKTILVCHGNSGSLGDLAILIRLLRATGASVFVFDYQGFGRSEGAPSVVGICQDAASAFSYLVDTKGILASDIVLYGESLGGAVACQLAKAKPVAGLILQSTFRDIRRIGFESFPPLGIFPRFLFPTPFFDNRSAVTGLKEIPVLIVHGANDPEIKIAHADALFSAAREPKTLLKLPNTLHDEIAALDAEIFTTAIEEFLARLAVRPQSTDAGRTTQTA